MVPLLRSRWCPHLGALGILLAASWTATACSVPVFRYALERWPPDPYMAIVFHRGPLPASDQELIRQFDLDQTTEEKGPNLIFKTVDLDDEPDPTALRLWEKQATDTLPWLALAYPRSAAIPGFCWSGPFSETALRALVDSPVRQELIRRLAGGDSAVWLFLESGNAEKDEAAAGLLQEQLARLENELEIPRLDAADVAQGLVSVPQEALRVAFSLLRLARNDPAEEVLVKTLLGTEEDLAELQEPMVFPIFGRGRALYALVGKGINPEVLEEAGAFLIGPCSCQVKELNPGVDLLMTAHWEGLIKSSFMQERELPPLTGFAGMAPGDEPPEKPEAAPAAAKPANPEDSETVTPAAHPAAESDRALRFYILVLGIAGLVLVAGGTLVILLRK